MRKVSRARSGAGRPAERSGPGLTGLALSLVASAAGANTATAVPAASVTIPLGSPPAAAGLASVTTGLPATAAQPAVSLPSAALSPPVTTAPIAAMEEPGTLDTPVEDCSITSPYGWRIHPILHRRRFHKGVDFGAPEGTPVHASADGVIEEMGRRGHYGLYLRIRHSGTVQTAYAHLEGFTPGLAVGATVRRGEVVANVGHTGWAPGPHL